MLAAVALLAGWTAVATAAGQPTPLRVCADPNNPPFSNERGQGFDNRIAAVVARELGRPLEYAWRAPRRGLLRQTLGAGACDAMFGTPVGFEGVLLSRPYYHSTYVFAWRRDDGPAVRSLADPALRSVRVGVQLVGADYTNTPPAHALARRGIVTNVRGYSVYGDGADAEQPGRIMRALAAREIDVAIVWGPLAGWSMARLPVALSLAPVAPSADPPGLQFTFAIAVAVRPDAVALRDRLDRALDARRAEIDAILSDYGVPRPGRPND